MKFDVEQITWLTLLLDKASRVLASCDPAEAADPRHIHKLEHAKSDATLRMVEDIGRTTGYAPSHFLRLADRQIATNRSLSYFESLRQELTDFEAAGGLVNLATLVEHGPVEAPKYATTQKQAQIQATKPMA